jgi:DNA-binding MarR family transcriptional regulator
MGVRATALDTRSIAMLDRVVHEPVRLSILACLYVVDEADFVFLQSQTEITGGNLSSHIRRLDAEGYVSIRKEFENQRPKTTLSLTKAGREAFEAYVGVLEGMLRSIKNVR